MARRRRSEVADETTAAGPADGPTGVASPVDDARATNGEKPARSSGKKAASKAKPASLPEATEAVTPPAPEPAIKPIRVDGSLGAAGAMANTIATPSQRAGADNVDFRPGDMTALPIDDASVDAAISMLVLHHLPRPALAVKEIARILRPGGLALIVDMAEHTRAEYRRTMGHEHLGFDRAAVSAWAKAASLTLVRHRRLRPDTDGRGPGLFAAALRRPS